MNQMLARNQIWDVVRARQILHDMFDAAVRSAAPAEVLAKRLPAQPKGRCVVIGAGKAAGAMAVAVEAAWPGVVVAPYGYAGKTSRIAMCEAAHPVPDANSEAAAAAILAAVKGLTADDMVLALISGGGSSVMALPAPGLTLADKQVTNRALLASGLDIRTMNIIRRRLSAIKGGKLAAAASPAKIVTLAISDIPGDDPAAIASGPTVPDTDATVDISAAVDLLEHRLPKAVVDRLRRPPTPPASLSDCEFRMIATPLAALEAAAAVARAAGLAVEILGDDIEGEARQVGAAMASLARGLSSVPRVILSGGETTVTLEGSKPGRGGRNTEFLLALANQLNGEPGVWGLAGDTDGADGASGGAAGAIFSPDSVRRGVMLGLDAEQSLADHDSGGYFAALNDLVVTGPTQTNVNDFRAILIVPSAPG